MFPNLHIHAPVGEYVGQIRKRGHRRWTAVGKPAKTAKDAIKVAVDAMQTDHNRARVLFCAEWYEPIIVMELKT